MALVLAIAAAPSGQAIPPPPPEGSPDAIRLSQAIAELLIARQEADLRWRTAHAVAQEASAWAMRTHAQDYGVDAALDRRFHDTVRARSMVIWDEARGEILTSVARHFAALPDSDLRGILAFLQQDPGRGLALILASGDLRVFDADATGVIYRRLFPELPGLFAQSLAGAQP